MRHYPKLLLLVVALGTAVWAQEPYHSDDPDWLARLSYKRSPIPGQDIRQICIAVSQEGNYRMLSLRDDSRGPTRSQGKMSKDQLLELKKLLIAPAFRSLPGNHGGVIRNYSENFMAEISRVELPVAFQLDEPKPSGPPRSKPGPPRWVQWLNPDDQSPFPASIAQIVDWLKNFKPQNASQLGDSDISNVCPSVGFSLVQPSVATNEQQ
jgi:hypothetical protein